MSGDNQVGATAKALANPFVVVVTNAGGIPVAGVDVTFTITADGGTLPGGSPQLVVTDSQGCRFHYAEPRRYGRSQHRHRNCYWFGRKSSDLYGHGETGDYTLYGQWRHAVGHCGNGPG